MYTKLHTYHDCKLCHYKFTQFPTRHKSGEHGDDRAAAGRVPREAPAGGEVRPHVAQRGVVRRRAAVYRDTEGYLKEVHI